MLNNKTPMTANTLKFLIDAIETRSDKDYYEVRELLEKYDVDDVGDLTPSEMQEVGETLLSNFIYNDFKGVPKEIKGNLTPAEMDKAISELGLSPEEESAVRKVCKDGYVFAPELEMDNYPSTQSDKISYAKYIAVKSLENISKVLNRFDRLQALSDLHSPEIIINNECRMTLEELCPACSELNESLGYVREVFAETKSKRS